jgi:hypothetical protein
MKLKTTKRLPAIRGWLLFLTSSYLRLKLKIWYRLQQSRKPADAHTIYISLRVSSGSIVSSYGLDDRAIGVRSPVGSKDFSSSLCVQTGSGAHPASCTMGTGGPFSGGKARPGRDADHSPPSSAEVVNE